MPTYEYECTKCGYVFERFQSMTDEPVKRCPECRCKVRRLLGTGAGIIFKGSGFYQTDYRSSDYQAAAKKESSAATESSSESKKTEKKESKPAKTKKADK
jgi:putative FmdB family regulatory protein